MSSGVQRAQQPSDQRERAEQVGGHGATVESEAGWMPGGAGHDVRQPFGGQPLPPAAVLGLQRMVGNQDVQRYLSGQLQRQPPAAKPGAAGQPTAPGNGTIRADMFEIVGGDVASPGKVTAKLSGEKVAIDSPQVDFDATVKLKSGVKVGGENDGRVDVGPVQTLLGSDFTGVYRKGGDPNGEITYRERQTAVQSRDAQWDRKADGGRKEAVVAPWYSQPSNFSDSNGSATIHFHDQPGNELHQQVGDSRLTETTGRDRFIVSTGVKRDGQLIHLKPQRWEVDWNLQIDNKGTGVGLPISAGASKEGPPTTDGPIAVLAAMAWGSFTSVEAAMATSPAILFENLLPAKANDQTAYGFICEALRRKNPAFSVKVKVDKTAAWFGKDNVVLSVTGTKQAGKQVEVGAGDEQTASFNLNDVVDVASIDGNTKLTIAAQDFGEMWAVFSRSEPLGLIVGYPFAAASTTGGAGGGSRYTLSFTF